MYILVVLLASFLFYIFLSTVPHAYTSCRLVWPHFWSTVKPECRFLAKKLIPLEPVCCKKQQKSSWPVIGLRNREPSKDLNDSKLFVYDSKWFTWSSRINFISFRIFRGPLFHKPLIGHELFFAVSYSKPALVVVANSNTVLKQNLLQWPRIRQRVYD